MNPERIPYGRDANQLFELWHCAEEPTGFVVYIHGGFWRARYDLSHANPFCAVLAERGVVTANLEYRRVGQTGGGWPGSFEDVVAGLSAASEQVGRVPVVVGHSAGGHLALRLAAEAVSIKAVVALAPVADLRLAHRLNLSDGAVQEFLGGVPETISSRYDEACASTWAASVRRTVVHGTKDEDVPMEVSEAFVRARQNDPEPPSLMKIAAAGHMDLIDPLSPAGSCVLELVACLARD